MKIDKEVQRAVAVVGILIALIFGMMVENIFKVITPGDGFTTAALVMGGLTVFVFGMLAFSEYE